MAFSAPEYCRLFAQKKAYQGGGEGHGHPRTPPSYAPVAISGERAIRTVKLEYWSFHLFFLEMNTF